MAFQPMPLSRRPLPFDHPEWVFELKYDGFRSLTVIHDGRTELISRNGHPFNSFDTLRKASVSTSVDDRSSMTCSSTEASHASLHSIC